MSKHGDVTVYYVSASQTTTDEPMSGWYFEDVERCELRGPFMTRELAMEAAGVAPDYSYEPDERSLDYLEQSPETGFFPHDA